MALLSWSKKILFFGFTLGQVVACSTNPKVTNYEPKITKYPVLNAIGYAPISSQQGDSKNAKMFMAMKASKIEAYRELLEQLQGFEIFSDVNTKDMLLENDKVYASVSGIVRGAKVVKSYPLGDAYATELKLDTKDLEKIKQLIMPISSVY